jgi:hypothetical protein
MIRAGSLAVCLSAILISGCVAEPLETSFSQIASQPEVFGHASRAACLQGVVAGGRRLEGYFIARNSTEVTPHDPRVIFTTKSDNDRAAPLFGRNVRVCGVMELAPACWGMRESGVTIEPVCLPEKPIYLDKLTSLTTL